MLTPSNPIFLPITFPFWLSIFLLIQAPTSTNLFFAITAPLFAAFLIFFALFFCFIFYSFLFSSLISTLIIVTSSKANPRYCMQWSHFIDPRFDITSQHWCFRASDTFCSEYSGLLPTWFLLLLLISISFFCSYSAIAAYLATSLGFAPNTAQHAECQAVVASLYDVFIKKECTLLEINPLVETASGTVSLAISLDTNCYLTIYHSFYQTPVSSVPHLRTPCWHQNHPQLAFEPPLLPHSCPLLPLPIQSSRWWYVTRNSVSMTTHSSVKVRTAIIHAMKFEFVIPLWRLFLALYPSFNAFSSLALSFSCIKPCSDSVFQFRDRTQEDSREVEAAKYDLNYIGLTGTSICAVIQFFSLLFSCVAGVNSLFLCHHFCVCVHDN